MRKLPRIERSEIRGTFIVLSGQNILFFCVICQNKEGRVSGFVWGGVCWGVCGGVLRGVLGVCWVCVGACVAWGWGHGLEKVSLAALLSGYLGKSGHLPR